MYLPSISELDAAAAIVYSAMAPTPQLSWPLLDRALGAEAWVKHENHLPTGAFKARGGVVYLQRLLQRQPEVRGVIAVTRGNHGQSLAFAARRLGLRTSIVVPHGNSVEKNAAMRALGADLIEYGADFQESREHAQMLAQRDGLHMVPSCHDDLIAGVASGWCELFRAQPDLDLVLVPLGQGSGICAAVAARHALGLKTRIIGVVSSHAPAYQLSFRAGRAIEAPVDTWLADGVACRATWPGALPTILECVDDVLAVSDAEVAAAMRLYHSATHNLAEGAGAAALAAALQLKDDARLKGRRVGLTLSGANVDSSVFLRVLGGA
ncbi:threonine dehydratase [Janthinobacterium sp.]|uniref:threonine dehydratase n=1 Tax=Janthinobacterium sp. TaxID=1871054 RepID=UPI00293D8408|nr:threonine dehydratase [Janthinobacterium sp.]